MTVYTRWKKRRHTQVGLVKNAKGLLYKKPGLPKDSYSLTASLVESERVNGVPRQRFVAYLGTMQVWDNNDCPVVIATGGTVYEAHLVNFWRAVEKRLDALGDVVPDREQIELKIAKVVPCPDADTRQRIDKAREAWLDQLEQAFSTAS